MYLWNVEAGSAETIACRFIGVKRFAIERAEALTVGTSTSGVSSPLAEFAYPRRGW
jgi:hypothetical protein